MVVDLRQLVPAGVVVVAAVEVSFVVPIRVQPGWTTLLGSVTHEQYINMITCTSMYILVHRLTYSTVAE